MGETKQERKWVLKFQYPDGSYQYGDYSYNAELRYGWIWGAGVWLNKATMFATASDAVKAIIRAYPGQYGKYGLTDLNLVFPHPVPVIVETTTTTVQSIHEELPS